MCELACVRLRVCAFCVCMFACVSLIERPELPGEFSQERLCGSPGSYGCLVIPYRGKLRRGKVTKFSSSDENFPRRNFCPNEYFSPTNILPGE